MKEASGELNMTIIAIAAIAGLFTVFLLPRLRGSIENRWDEAEQNASNY